MNVALGHGLARSLGEPASRPAAPAFSRALGPARGAMGSGLRAPVVVADGSRRTAGSRSSMAPGS